MPTPPECQPIVDALAKLLAAEQAQRKALSGLAGIDKWKAIEAVGSLRRQIADQQAALAQCEKDHAADLLTEVIVTDLTGDSGSNRIARVWQLTSTGQAVKQTVTVQGGTATLAGVLGAVRQTFGITIEETDHPTVNGPDFRSGPLPLPGVNQLDPASRIEIVILEPIAITAGSLNQNGPALPIQLPFAAGPLGTVTISIANLQMTIASGEISLVATGTASAPLTNSPFTFLNRFHIAPTFTMAPSTLVEILPDGMPSVTMPGLVGSFVQDLAPLLSASLIDLAIRPVGTLLNRLVAEQVLARLGLDALPSGSVLSVRQLTADDQTMTIVPALGAFGTVLSDFQPSPTPVVPTLASLDVQPALLNTADRTNSSAIGTVLLMGVAPPGGVTVQLSCDRRDVIVLDPPAVTIAEGLTRATFTAFIAPQPIMGTSTIDATVSASLGTQTITARLSVQPQPAATPTPSVPSAVAAAGAAAPAGAAPPVVAAIPGITGIWSITFMPPPPLRSGIVHGQVFLDRTADTANEIVTLIFDPPALGQVNVIVPVGFRYAYFAFELGAAFSGNSLRITALVASSGVKKVIDVAVAQ